MIFHPGRILDVYSDKKKGKGKVPSSETQALINMWDDNTFVLRVDSKISEKIKKNDMVLVDYSPVSEKIPVPKQLICKILSVPQGNFLWQTFKEKLRKKKKEGHTPSGKVTGKKQGPFGSYMG